VFTGHQPHDRAQIWWRLDEAEQNAATVKALLGQIQARLGSDAAVVDPVRIMRLAGTIAWPTKFGRVAELTEWQQVNGADVYGIERLKAIFASAENKPSDGMSADVFFGLDEAALIEAARVPGQRHRSKLRLVGHWVTLGYSDVAIMLMGEGIGHDSEATRQKFAKMIADARAKWGMPNPAQDFGTAPIISWPEPLDILGAPELTGYPELTPECLPAPLYRYVMTEAERLTVDPCPLAGHVLAACSASISDAWAIKPKQHDHWTQQARLWVTVVKDIGTRGTDTIRSAFWPVRERDKELFNNWKREHAEWEERRDVFEPECGRKGRGQKKADPADPEPICPRLISNDPTVEAASQILAGGGGYGKLTLLQDELAAFFGSFARYSKQSGSARALWLEAYDGGPQRIDRIIRGHVFVPNWSVVIAGNIQTRKLQEFGTDLITDGLFQRMMTVHARPTELGVDDDTPLNLNVGREYRELHEALAAMQPTLGDGDTPIPAYADEDGRSERKALKRLWERLQADPTMPTVIRETAPKWSGLIARLSLIFHLVGLADLQRAGEQLEPRDLHHVTGATVASAATFIRRILLPNLFRLGFETMPDAGALAARARWIAGHILAHKLESITASQIGRAHRDLRGKPQDAADAMAMLVDAGWAVRTEGRSTSLPWLINPAVHARFAATAAAEKERRDKVRELFRTKVNEL
jgi:Protein of unknown function (DUF3987)